MYKTVYLDVDETLADFIGRFLRNYNAEHGTQHTKEDVVDWEFSTILQPGQTWRDYIDPDFWTDLDPLPWAHDLVAAVRDLNVPYAFLTYLPIGSALEGRRIWLDKHFTVDPNDPPSKRLIVTGKKDLVVYGQNRLLIDDAPHNVLDVRKTGATAFCLAQPWNVSVPDRMTPESILERLRERTKPGHHVSNWFDTLSDKSRKVAYDLIATLEKRSSNGNCLGTPNSSRLDMPGEVIMEWTGPKHTVTLGVSSMMGSCYRSPRLQGQLNSCIWKLDDPVPERVYEWIQETRTGRVHD